mmetsp:Transcript_15798/g.43697  ORF Transcript_15798/g.43697 Transcript_15798/m.43697 type:complete len:334 (+) Transcript_15798:73-1074(+)
MGQSASKGLSKAAEAAAKRAPSSQLKRPPLPSRTPSASPSATASATPEPTHDNPASFLRGEGVGAHDIRDRGQEMYLQHVQQQRQQQQQQQQQQSPASSQPHSGGDASPPVNTEMPADLLKFITDVGPAKQTVDREFTTTRLLREENAAELNKAESTRTTRRERMRMPLMQGEDDFTTEKNTNFSFSPASAQDTDEHDFGLSNLQLYDLVGRQPTDTGSLDDFHKTITTESDAATDGAPSSSPSSEAEQAKPRELALLSQAAEVLEVPTLRMNADGDILGLYGKDVPGPEMASIKTIPEDKVILVLKDLSIHGTSSDRATDKLEELRKERKAI